MKSTRTSLIVTVLMLGAGCSSTAQDLGSNDLKADSGGGTDAAGVQTVDPANLTHCQQVCLQFGPEACTRSCLGVCNAAYGANDCDSKLAGATPIGLACVTTADVLFITTIGPDPRARQGVGCTQVQSSQGKYLGALPDGGWNQGKRVFVTSGSWAGSEIKFAGGTSNGLRSADQLCQNEADSDARGGSWKAWLSDATTTAASRITGAGPWYVADRSALAFRNRASWSVGPLGPLGSDGFAWTGSSADGTSRKANVNPALDDGFCQGWTASVPGAGVGVATVGNLRSAEAPEWSQTMDDDCSTKHHLYCFEQ